MVVNVLELTHQNLNKAFLSLPSKKSELIIHTPISPTVQNLKSRFSVREKIRKRPHGHQNNTNAGTGIPLFDY